MKKLKANNQLGVHLLFDIHFLEAILKAIRFTCKTLF